MAKDCLAGYISYMEEEEQKIPKATIPYTKKLDENSFVQLIEAYLPPYRDEYYNKMERKNVTIPRWLNQIAKEKKINCSALLVSALKKKIRIFKIKIASFMKWMLFLFYIVAIFFAILANFSLVSEFGLPLQAIGNSTIFAPSSSTCFIQLLINLPLPQPKVPKR